MGIKTVVVVLLSASLRMTAQQAEQGARELYYAAMVRQDPPPPARRTAPRTTSSTSPKAGGGGTASIIPASTAAMHLGLRYNLALVDENSGKSELVAPDRIFRAGECFALEVESNRAGFLYVLAKQSSGTWHPLLPSKDAEMSTESNEIEAAKKVRVPLHHCFELQDPPGVETLFVVLSREPRDTFDLYQDMKNPEPQRQVPARPSAAVEVADTSVGDGTIARMREQYGTRDIAIKKVSQPLAPAETPQSVYVVSASNSPASNVAAQIEVRHR